MRPRRPCVAVCTPSWGAPRAAIDARGSLTAPRPPFMRPLRPSDPPRGRRCCKGRRSNLTGRSNVSPAPPPPRVSRNEPLVELACFSRGAACGSVDATGKTPPHLCCPRAASRSSVPPPCLDAGARRQGPAYGNDSDGAMWRARAHDDGVGAQPAVAVVNFSSHAEAVQSMGRLLNRGRTAWMIARPSRGDARSVET